jgi:putative transposase
MIDKISEKRSVSVRRSCDVLGFRRQTYYRRRQGCRPEEENAAVAEALRQTTQRFVCWGFWMVFHFLRRKNHPWNHKRVYRIWKELGLNLRVRPQRPKIKRKFLELLAPSRINEGWAVDFLSDWVIGPGGEKVRIVNIMDECSRKALWTEAHSSICAKLLTQVLDTVAAWRGYPAYIRCDNGPEFISEQLSLWAKKNGVEIRFIQAGKPSQNGLIERLNGTLRAECLNLEWFRSMEELNEQIQQWTVIYNTVRPHSSIGYQTPDEFELKQQNLYFKAVAA